MPAIVDLPPKPPFVIVDSAFDAQGAEGRYLIKAAEFALLHWEDRAERLLSDENGAKDDTIGYESVPLNSAGFVRVQYKNAGEIEPIPYDWDD